MKFSCLCDLETKRTDNNAFQHPPEETIIEAFAEITELKRKIEEDNLYLREEIQLVHNFEEIIGNNDANHYMLFKVQQVAPTDAMVFILGETGTGKELIARAIHNATYRNSRPLIKVNCAALMPSLIESELFGHEKGAFTSAGAKRTGRFELADGATLFLDDLPLLVDWFVNKYSHKAGKRFNKVPAETMKALMGYSWPGNVREFENIIERAVITSQGRILTFEVPLESNDIGDIPERGNTLSDMERQIILKVLERKKWRIEGPFGTARPLGINPSTLRHRMRKLGLTRPKQTS